MNDSPIEVNSRGEKTKLSPLTNVFCVSKTSTLSKKIWPWPMALAKHALNAYDFLGGWWCIYYL